MGTPAARQCVANAALLLSMLAISLPSRAWGQLSNAQHGSNGASFAMSLLEPFVGM
jgi:hypothetical protein